MDLVVTKKYRQPIRCASMPEAVDQFLIADWKLEPKLLQGGEVKAEMLCGLGADGSLELLGHRCDDPAIRLELALGKARLSLGRLIHMLAFTAAADNLVASLRAQQSMLAKEWS